MSSYEYYDVFAFVFSQLSICDLSSLLSTTYDRDPTKDLLHRGCVGCLEIEREADLIYVYLSVFTL
jgi:hypothetical protein